MAARIQFNRQFRWILLLFAVLIPGCVDPVFDPQATGTKSTAVASTPNTSPELLSTLARGRNALAIGQHPQARDHYLSAVRISAGDPRAVLGLAESYLALGQTEEAVRLLGQIKATPGVLDLARLDQARGIAALRVKRPEEATRFLERAVATDPGLWRSWIALGRLQLDADRKTDAAAAFLMAEQAAPDTASAHNDLGMAYLRLEHPDSALSHLQRALQIRPDHRVAQANLRIVKATKGDFRGAMAGVEPADRPDALNNAGYVAMLKGNYELADKYLRRAIELSPTHHEIAVANLESIPD